MAIPKGVPVVDHKLLPKRVTRAALSRILNGRAGISPDMAVRLGKWLGHSPESWLRMQMDYDLWQAERRPHPNVRRLKQAA